jgi:hypothetical protein
MEPPSGFEDGVVPPTGVGDGEKPPEELVMEGSPFHESGRECESLAGVGDGGGIPEGVGYGGGVFCRKLLKQNEE